jgi:hypothetical protein
MAVQYQVQMPDGSTRTVLANSQDAANNNAGLSSGGSPAAPAPAPARSAAPASVPAPAAMNLGDTNQQSTRADLRNQGYYIDNSGVYAPGAGQRVGDTWSGANAGQNTAPSPTRLPVINGTPVSPSNGFTGVQTPAVMYRGDPAFNTYFGEGTPGYSSRNPDLGAGALPAGQATLPGQAPPAAPPATEPLTMGPLQSGLAAGAQPAAQPAVAGGSRGTGGEAAGGPGPNAPSSGGAPAYQTQFQQPSDSGYGFGPYATSQPPTLTVQGQYVDGANVIEKSVDQYGNAYYQKVGDAAPPRQDQGAQPAPGAAAPAAPGSSAPQPAPPAGPGKKSVSVALPDGTVFTGDLSPQDQAQLQSDLAGIAKANADALKFTQGIQQGQLDIQRLTQVATQAYQTSLIQNQSVANAQQAAYQAMQIDVQRQAQELQRNQQAQTVGLEREKLDLQRQQLRHTARRRSAVQYR